MGRINSSSIQLRVLMHSSLQGGFFNCEVHDFLLIFGPKFKYLLVSVSSKCSQLVKVSLLLSLCFIFGLFEVSDREIQLCEFQFLVVHDVFQYSNFIAANSQIVC